MPAFNAGKFQKLFHHLGQPLGLAQDDVEAFLHLFLILELPAGQGLAPAADRRQRGAQLMETEERNSDFSFSDCRIFMDMSLMVSVSTPISSSNFFSIFTP